MKKSKILSILILFSAVCFAQTSPLLIPYRFGNKWGYSDTSGKIIIAPKYDYAWPFSDYKNIAASNQLAIVKTAKVMYCINAKGQRTTPSGFINYGNISFRDKVFEIVSDTQHRWGVYANGRVVIPVKYDGIAPLNEYWDAFKVSKDEKVGIISISGETVVPVKFDDVGIDLEASTKNKLVWNAYISLEKRKEEDNIVQFNQVIKLDKIPKSVFEIGEVRDLGNYLKEIEEKLKQNAGVDKVEMIEKHKLAIIEKRGKQGILLYDTSLLFFKENYKLSHYSTLFSPSMLNPVKTDYKLYIVVETKGKFGIINGAEEVILPIEYDFIKKEYQFDYPDFYFVIEKGEKFGLYIFGKSDFLVTPQYDRLIGTSTLKLSNDCKFRLFHIETQKSSGWIGQNGIEFFKD